MSCGTDWLTQELFVFCMLGAFKFNKSPSYLKTNVNVFPNKFDVIKLMLTFEFVFETNGSNKISLFVFEAFTNPPNKSLGSVFSDSGPNKSNKLSGFDVTGSSSIETDEKFNNRPSLGLFNGTSVFGGKCGLGGGT